MLISCNKEHYKVMGLVNVMLLAIFRKSLNNCPLRQITTVINPDTNRHIHHKIDDAVACAPNPLNGPKGQNETLSHNSTIQMAKSLVLAMLGLHAVSLNPLIWKS